MIRREIRTRNDAFQQLVSLRDNRHKRSKRGLLFVEGIAIIKALLESDVPVHAFITARSRKLSDWARGTLAVASADEHLVLDDDLYAELSDRTEPTELIAIARKPALRMADLGLQELQRVVVLDRPASPGNLGTCLRSCLAFGVEAVIVLGHAADPWDPQSLRASLGAAFRLPLVTNASPRALLERVDMLRGAHAEFRFLGTDSDGDVPLRRTTGERGGKRNPVILVFGNEATGLSESLKGRLDGILRIETSGSLHSLNLASALSIVLYAFWG